ncbi:unnamed protein product [Pedinophyceae sp. YPF-701]|nr:unnamed protein product [Pedinophyceae sp. YPF-701]
MAAPGGPPRFKSSGIDPATFFGGKLARSYLNVPRAPGQDACATPAVPRPGLTDAMVAWGDKTPIAKGGLLSGSKKGSFRLTRGRTALSFFCQDPQNKARLEAALRAKFSDKDLVRMPPRTRGKAYQDLAKELFAALSEQERGPFEAKQLDDALRAYRQLRAYARTYPARPLPFRARHPLLPAPPRSWAALLKLDRGAAAQADAPPPAQPDGGGDTPAADAAEDAPRAPRRARPAVSEVDRAAMQMRAVADKWRWHREFAELVRARPEDAANLRDEVLGPWWKPASRCPRPHVAADAWLFEAVPPARGPPRTAVEAFARLRETRRAVGESGARGAAARRAAAEGLWEAAEGAVRERLEAAAEAARGEYEKMVGVFRECNPMACDAWVRECAEAAPKAAKKAAAAGAGRGKRRAVGEEGGSRKRPRGVRKARAARQEAEGSSGGSEEGHGQDEDEDEEEFRGSGEESGGEFDEDRLCQDGSDDELDDSDAVDFDDLLDDELSSDEDVGETDSGVGQSDSAGGVPTQSTSAGGRAGARGSRRQRDPSNDRGASEGTGDSHEHGTAGGPDSDCVDHDVLETNIGDVLRAILPPGTPVPPLQPPARPRTSVAGMHSAPGRASAVPATPVCATPANAVRRAPLLPAATAGVPATPCVGGGAHLAGSVGPSPFSRPYTEGALDSGLRGDASARCVEEQTPVAHLRGPPRSTSLASAGGRSAPGAPLLPGLERREPPSVTRPPSTRRAASSSWVPGGAVRQGDDVAREASAGRWPE